MPPTPRWANFWSRSDGNRPADGVGCVGCKGGYRFAVALAFGWDAGFVLLRRPLSPVT